MVVCRNWASGYCRFGDKCKFEHVQENNQRNNGPSRGGFQRGPSPTRQGPRNNQQGPRNNSNNNNNNNNHSNQRANSPPGRNGQRRNSPHRNQRRSHPYRDEVPYKQMTEASIEDDLTIDRPQWFCSAYGPVSGLCATQLFGGAMECSMEEARCQFYLNALNGNVDAAKAEEEALGQRCLAQISNAVSDLHGAVKYLRDGANVRPNRADIVRKANTAAQGDNRRGTRDYFSRENAERRRRQEGRRNANNAQQSTNPFGQQQPANPSPFGQSQPQPQPQPQPPPQAGNNPIFGQPAPFGNPVPFAQPLQPAFGGPSNNAFGQQPQQNAFGQPQQPQTSNFGQARQPINNAFAVPQITAPPPAPSQPAIPPTNLGQVTSGPSSFPNQVPNGGPPIAQASNAVNGQAGSGTSFNQDGTLSFWNFNPIHYVKGVPLYKLPSGADQRVWFPNGEPKATEFFGAHLPPPGDYPEEYKRIYEELLKTGQFGGDNLVPDMAPRPEWCGWNV